MASHQSYGSRRLVTALEAQGIQVGRYRVRHLIRQAGLKSVWKRKFIHTTDSKYNLPIAAYILDRQFNKEIHRCLKRYFIRELHPLIFG
ncbi:MAG: IS3 family transposase [Betaproteobacteria bacterium]|nr:IS3 family transposase [Betaproteobacteria bacterium]